MKYPYFQIRDRHSGTAIEDCQTYPEAEARIKTYEAIDRREGNFTHDFYEIFKITEDFERLVYDEDDSKE